MLQAIKPLNLLAQFNLFKAQNKQHLHALNTECILQTINYSFLFVTQGNFAQGIILCTEIHYFLFLHEFLSLNALKTESSIIYEEGERLLLKWDNSTCLLSYWISYLGESVKCKSKNTVLAQTWLWFMCFWLHFSLSKVFIVMWPILHCIVKRRWCWSAFCLQS